jgi:sulfite exporter TauE/SafE
VEPSTCCDGLGVDPAEPLTGLILLGTGLTMSLGHCVGMCGPLLTAFSVSQRSAGAAPGWRLAPALGVYHLGRITSYGILGVLFGLLGTVAGAVSSARLVQAGISLAVGLLMIPLGLGLMGLLPTQRWIESSPLAGFVVGRMRSLLATRRPFGRYGLGVANGFLPCGPVVVTALAASTSGGPWRGGLAMLIYGIGTIPALVALGMGTGLLGPRLRVTLYRIGALLLIVLAAQLVLRGAAAFGWVPHWRVGPVVFW